jgi:hypothetical protein
MRGNWLNRIFGVEYEGLTIRIGANCTHTLADYANVKEAPGGEKLKTRTRDRTTGRTYEPHGHCSDANDYFLCTLWADSYRRFARAGKKLGLGRVSGEF